MSSLSAGSGEKFVEKARIGSSAAINGWSAFCATLMSLTLVSGVGHWSGWLLGVEDEGALLGGEAAPEGGLFGRVGDGLELLDERRGLGVAARRDRERLRAGRAVAFGGDALGGLRVRLERLDLRGERGDLLLRLGEFLGGGRGGSERLLRGGEVAGKLVALLGQLTVGEREGFLFLGQRGDLLAVAFVLMAGLREQRGAGGGVALELA